MNEISSFLFSCVLACSFTLISTYFSAFIHTESQTEKKARAFCAFSYKYYVINEYLLRCSYDHMSNHSYVNKFTSETSGMWNNSQPDHQYDMQACIHACITYTKKCTACFAENRVKTRQKLVFWRERFFYYTSPQWLCFVYVKNDTSIL